MLFLVEKIGALSFGNFNFYASGEREFWNNHARKISGDLKLLKYGKNCSKKCEKIF